MDRAKQRFLSAVARQETSRKSKFKRRDMAYTLYSMDKKLN
jgi:hypothetical protein